MSSPRSIGGSVREGTRVVLREITASLHNSPPMQPPRRKSGTDSSSTPSKAAEHEVKVRFAREFADVGSITTYSAPESLSSASSFQSLNSTLSAKSSSGICPDSSVPASPSQAQNVSYSNPNISGVDDLIVGCAAIHLNSDEDRSFGLLQNSQDLSHDQTFASAIDEPVGDLTIGIANDISLTESANTTRAIEDSPTRRDSVGSTIEHTQQDVEERPIISTICVREPLPVVAVTSDRRNSFIKVHESVRRSVSPAKDTESIDSDRLTNGTVIGPDIEEVSLPQCYSTEESALNTTTFLSPAKQDLNGSVKEEDQCTLENHTTENHALSLTFVPSTLDSTATLESSLSDHAEELSLPSIPTFSSLLISTESTKLSESDATEDRNSPRSRLADSPFPVNNCNVAQTSPPRIVAKSPVEGLVERPNDGASAEDLSTNLCDNVARDERDGVREIPLDETPVARPKSPTIRKGSPTKVFIEDSGTVFDNVELSPPKGDSLEVNVTPYGTDEVETTKSDEFPSKREDIEKTDAISSITEQDTEEIEQESSGEQLDSTITLRDVSLNLESVPEVEQYTEFQPQRQSTTLATLATLDIAQPNFEELKSAAEEVANDIFKSSFEFTEDTDRFVSATSEIFQDPTSFDFLIKHGNTKTINRLRAESLYVKFDPLVGDTSMLPQGNGQSIDEEQNGKSESIPANIGTPKRNAAIAAIDRLLVYSPICTSMTQKTDEPEEKMEQPPEEPKLGTPLITDVNMSKELELVRATVLQLEEELEKQKKEYEAELDKRKLVYQDKINKLQAQMAQEVKSKSQMTVVVEEYEKSISRLLTERERDRTTFEQEIAKLQEELQTTNVHLNNTEAAFNDVHQKYERLKGVVSAYKSNESVLKESIQENMETIKGLETRYDHLKNHAMTQLEKANFELETIRKQHEDETVKLHAMVRKAELKSNSLAELVEQKTKENKELAQILDEVIARVGHQNAE